MIEKVIALCMFLAGEMIEHSPKESLSDCLEVKRKIEETHQKVVVLMLNVLL